MNKEAKTHCLGRYLIDLPASAKVTTRYVYSRGKIATRVDVSPEGYAKLLSEQEDALKAARHDDGGSMLVDRVEFAPGKVSLISWKSPHSRILYQYRYFAYLPERRVLFLLEGEGSAKAEARARADKAGGELVTELLRYREGDEVPKSPGYCFDHGLVADNALNQEEFTANIKLKEYPSVTLTLMSYVTGKPDRELLQRASRIPPGFERAVAHMKTLRRGDRNIGPVKGQELLVRADAEGKRSYHFLWESQGRANSLEFPFMSLQLSTTDETDARGEVIDAPFESDEEALELWDSILTTLRLRPGAV
ncbi:T6SS immunity protein Tli4 family protein [Vulcaniibacterium tengchongense]|uniref:Tle cognate immunity protein 4 C-terminal domain-containing protein n=1 Tax=Vulcaniibacterium tengchongense TaxID=1273429 RepID=A0A3N4VCC0_9GAMM|nr:T6SS immunity protein Tli4 family protein [Vulcaniibacterium tengchongense]RPE74787.1 hypothetical protein EDC50_2999 [Vulcaniibacterium tengchongense]